MKKFLWFLQRIATCICGIAFANLSVALFKGDINDARASFVLFVIMAIPVIVAMVRLLRAIEREDRSKVQLKVDDDYSGIREQLQQIANANRRARMRKV